MLTDLVVEGLGVIDHAEISLGGGCSVLTGETGAGKTLVVAALALLRGGRADRTLVRHGAEAARVQGRWELPASHPVVDALVVEGVIDAPDEGPAEVVVTRTVPASGGTARARVNGRLVTLATVEAIGGGLVEIAGQQEHQRASSPAWQRTTLDRFAGDEAIRLADETRTAFKAAVRAERALEGLRAGDRERRRELDMLAHEIEEISAADVMSGEGERLARDAERMERAERIAAGLGEVLDALGGERGAGASLGDAASALARLADDDADLSDAAARVRSVLNEVVDVEGELARRTIPVDPAALDETRRRLEVLAKLKRKYGADEDEILGYLERAQTRLSALSDDDDSIGRLEADAAAHRARAASLARRLGKLRRSSAPRLERAMEEALDRLALPGARFSVGLEDRPLHEGGTETVAFSIAADPGEAPRPLARVASGGELSRISLALHLLASREEALTMVFDEVDAGVGGRAAQAVGQALAELAHTTRGQVVVVTHLPQVAAFADRHYRVTKAAGGGRATARVDAVAGDDRVAELSRMLAGLPESRRAHEHARELLALAGGNRS